MPVIDRPTEDGEGLGDAGPTTRPDGVSDSRPESYRVLADVFHAILSESDLEVLLERIAEVLADLVPYDTITIYEANEVEGVLTPVLARDHWAEQILASRSRFGDGLTGWAVQHRQPVLTNKAHEDPRFQVVPGTPLEPEALITVPLIGRGSIKGALNIYRVGEDAFFSDEEFDLAKRFGDAAALALDNAHTRANLERQARTDSLTGLWNHRTFHERLRAELNRASRAHDAVALLMADIDDFKRVNDMFGHSTGDHVLTEVAGLLREVVRSSDVACRVGGEEFAVIMPSCNVGDALGLATRIVEKLADTEFDPAGSLTFSVGVAEGPEHAMNPSELIACAEAAMMTAKARGKKQIVLFDEEATERPDAPTARRDVRSIAHLKMLQSLAGKLNRLKSVREIGSAIANELRTLIDYHNCRVYVVHEDLLVPIAFRGEIASYEEGELPPDLLVCRVGEGITGRVAQTGAPQLVPNALECEFAIHLGDSEEIEETLLAVPLNFGARTIGVVVISQLGIDQFDEDDVRLMEVLAGHASAALENARLYEAQRREAEHAKALLVFSDRLSNASGIDDIGRQTVRTAADLTDVGQVSLWLQADRNRRFHCTAHVGYIGDPTAESMIRTPVEPHVGMALIEDKKGIFVLTPEEMRAAFDIDEGPPLRHFAIAPLQSGDDQRGWLAVRSPSEDDRHFTEERLLVLAAIANQASTAMQKANLYRSQQESGEIASALLEFSRELAEVEGLPDVLNRIVAVSARLLGSPYTSVWLLDVETDSLVPEAAWGYNQEERQRIAEARLPGDRVRRLLKAEEPFVLKPEQLELVQKGLGTATRTLLAVAPIKLEGGRIGCIAAAAPIYGQYEFSRRKMRLLAGVAHQAKLAIENANSYQALEGTFFSTVEALANALEAKDHYTSTHAREITDMAIEVGSELGLDGSSLKRLELGALFHDIGKIGIPSTILLKPGPLSEGERDVMETHPELGERILAPIERLSEVRPIVRACHERWDGDGYPDGLVGPGIPLESRIIFVCDAFHAMTTDRPYRQALSVEEACRRLQEGAGTQFDPDAVEVFMRLLDQRPDFVYG